MIPAFINPFAGNANESRDALARIGGDAFDIQEVPPETLAKCVRAALEGGARRIAVAGGDGSIGTAAGVLAGTGVDLAILPGGTLNHLAKDLSIPLDLDEAVRLAANGRSIPVDVASVNERIFVNTSSVGAYVRFVRLRDRLETHLGYHAASLIAGARLLIRMPTFRITLDVEGAVREYVTPLVFVGVGERELKLPTLGARVAGGRPGLHVMVVRRRSGGRTLALALAAAARGIDAVAKTPAMDAFLVERFRIERVKRAAVDGEIQTMTPPIEYRFLEGGIRVVAP
jgi:diacylglycerol kinase family enzyme